MRLRDLLTAALLPSSASTGGPADYGTAADALWRHAAMPPTGDALPRELVRCATLAANSHNTQPWRFRIEPDLIVVRPDHARRTPVVDPDDHHLWISLGCAVENLVIAAAGYGRHAQPALRDGEVRIALHPMVPVRSLLFDAITRRQCTRGPYDGRPLADGELRALQTAAARPGVQLLLLTSPAQRDQVAQFVARGNDAQAADRAFVRELRYWLRFSERDALATRDGLFARCSGNPAAPAWLGRLLFDLLFSARAENAKATRHLASSAGVAVLAADGEGPEAWLEAGRACQRFQLMATAIGVCTAFINQPVEVAALRTPFAQAIGLGAARPDLVLRFGRGAAMTRSLRRPLSDVLAQ